MEDKEGSTANPSVCPSPTTPGTSSPSSPASPPDTAATKEPKKKSKQRKSVTETAGDSGKAGTGDGKNAEGGPEGRSSSVSAGQMADGDTEGAGTPDELSLRGPQRTIVEKDGKPMQRFTLSEAADEIKRLRRLVKQVRGDLKKAEEDLKTSQSQIGRLQAEHEQSENRLRQKEEETTRFKKEVDELNRGLDIAAEELRVLQATSLPLNEARKLTYKALRKGRALQCLADLFSKNHMTENLVREG
ncbi:hypothetical protein CSUI_005183, partial [Cystoisospora suis]